MNIPSTAKEISTKFQVTLNAGEAIINYLTWIGWGATIKEATEAASDFIETEADIDGMQKVLREFAN